MSVENYQGVTVAMVPTSNAIQGWDEEHKLANNIKVEEGHLVVCEYTHPIAIYAPGKWASAKVSPTTPTS